MWRWVGGVETRGDGFRAESEDKWAGHSCCLGENWWDCSFHHSIDGSPVL